MNPTLYKAFVEIGYKGFDKVGQYMSKAVSDVQKGLNNLNGVMSGWQSTMSSFAQSGSPLAFNTLGGSVELLKTRIGTAFTPVLLSAAKSVQQLSDWIKKLDPETRKQIATWATVGVVGVGLAATLGNLTMSVLKLGAAFGSWLIANPFLTGLLLVAGAAAKAYYEIDRLNKIRLDDEATRNRIANGGMTDEDVNQSWYARKLQNIKDPQERAKRARGMADSLQQQGAALTELTDKWRSDPLAGAAAGASGQWAETSKEIAKINKELQIVAQFFNAANAGKDPVVKKVPAKPKDESFALSGMRQLAGGRAGVGSLDSAYSNLNNMALGQDEIQRRILKEQMEANIAAQASAKNTQSIFEWLGMIGKG